MGRPYLTDAEIAERDRARAYQRLAERETQLLNQSARIARALLALNDPDLTDTGRLQRARKILKKT